MSWWRRVMRKTWVRPFGSGLGYYINGHYFNRYSYHKDKVLPFDGKSTMQNIQKISFEDSCHSSNFAWHFEFHIELKSATFLNLLSIRAACKIFSNQNLEYSIRKRSIYHRKSNFPNNLPPNSGIRIACPTHSLFIENAATHPKTVLRTSLSKLIQV